MECFYLGEVEAACSSMGKGRGEGGGDGHRWKGKKEGMVVRWVGGWREEK